MSSRKITREAQRGQSLVELALVIPLVILLFMGIFDFGRAVFAYNAVAEAARNGSRVAIVNQTSSDICQVAAERATGLGLPTTCAVNQAAVGVWHVSSCTTPNQFNCEQLIRVNYQFRAITPVIGNFIGPISLSSTSRVMSESACPAVPPSGQPCPRP